jgi:hypothetical protein
MQMFSTFNVESISLSSIKKIDDDNYYRTISVMFENKLLRISFYSNDPITLEIKEEQSITDK